MLLSNWPIGTSKVFLKLKFRLDGNIFERRLHLCEGFFFLKVFQKRVGFKAHRSHALRMKRHIPIILCFASFFPSELGASSLRRLNELMVFH